MKKVYLLLGLILILAAFITTASASDSAYDTPAPNVIGFEIPTGQYCVSDYREGDPFTICYCACEEEECREVVYTKPTDEPKPKPTDKPPTVVPTNEPTPEPTDRPEKEKCNSGRGNDSEGAPDCDPGNSGKNQGGD